jgi:hypothetical protein
LVPVIAERWGWYDAVDELETSSFVDGEIPPVTTWAKKNHPDLQPAGPGTVLHGLGACAGTGGEYAASLCRTAAQMLRQDRTRRLSGARCGN